MFRTLIAGVAALGLLITAAPTTAHAKDDILKGVLLGAALGGTVAVIANASNKSRKAKRHSHHRPAYSHSRPAYSHSRPGYSHSRPAAHRRPHSRDHRSYRRPTVVERRYVAPRRDYRRSDYGRSGHYRRITR